MAGYDDPFDSLMEDCHITSSQESDFKHCSYFGPSDRIDTACPFPPESPDDRDTEIVSPDVGSGTVVDLGRDTDLVFSEVEVDPTQGIEADSNLDGTFCMESEDGVSKRQLSTKSCSERSKSLDLESPEKSEKLSTKSCSERSKSLDLESPEKSEKLSTKSCSERLESLDLESPEKSDNVTLMKSPKKSDNVTLMKSPKNLTLSPGDTLVPELQNQQNRGESVDGKPRVTVSEKKKKFSILDVLRQLAEEEEDHERDKELCCLSLLEVAEKRRLGKF